MLDGYKTHIVSGLTILAGLIGIAEYVLSVDIPGVHIEGSPLDYILAGLGLSSVRDALRKLGL